MRLISNHADSVLIAAARLLRTQAATARRRSLQVIAGDEIRHRRVRAGTAEGGASTSAALVCPVRPDQAGVGRDGADSARGPQDVPTFRWLHGDGPRSREPADAHLTMHTEVVAGVRIAVRVAGELDIATSPRLSELLLRHIAGAVEENLVVADLAAVTFVDAAGLAVLHTAAAAADRRGVVFRVVGCSRSLLRLLELVGARAALAVE